MEREDKKCGSAREWPLMRIKVNLFDWGLRRGILDAERERERYGCMNYEGVGMDSVSNGECLSDCIIKTFGSFALE